MTKGDSNIIDLNKNSIPSKKLYRIFFYVKIYFLYLICVAIRISLILGFRISQNNRQNLKIESIRLYLFFIIAKSFETK